jgi:HSP90 family molecular chaperone
MTASPSNPLPKALIDLDSLRFQNETGTDQKDTESETPEEQNEQDSVNIGGLIVRLADISCSDRVQNVRQEIPAPDRLARVPRRRRQQRGHAHGARPENPPEIRRPAPSPFLEINPNHPLIKLDGCNRAARLRTDIAEAADLLLDQAFIIQGEPLVRPKRPSPAGCRTSCSSALEGSKS